MAEKKSTPSSTTKRSATTELVLGQAAQRITKAVAELKAANEEVSKLSSISEELTLLVANKEEQITALSVEFEEKKRQFQVQLELDCKADTERLLNEYLHSNGKVAITHTELSTLKKELAETKANMDADIKKQVASITSNLKNQFENDLRFLQAENKAVAAENASKIGTLSEKNKFLEEQVTKLYTQLDAERAAGVERAKAGSVGSINVGESNRK